MPSATLDAVWEAIRALPAGKVATYGDVADMVEGVRINARQIGRIMAACPEGVPWHRVVGAGGTLPIGKQSPVAEALQRSLLLREGVLFLPSGKIDMRSCRQDAIP